MKMNLFTADIFKDIHEDLPPKAKIRKAFDASLQVKACWIFLVVKEHYLGSYYLLTLILVFCNGVIAFIFKEKWILWNKLPTVARYSDSS